MTDGALRPHAVLAHSVSPGGCTCFPTSYMVAVLGCPSVRVHDPRVVETGIEVSSLLSAFPGHPLPAANTASFADTISVLGTDVASDTHETNGACPH